MTVLLLRLAAPLQSWGDSSRFVRRLTRTEPTKSGVLGLIAAAQGRRRTDSIEDLLGLSFGVRVDQPGSLVRDFHTAHKSDGTSMPLSYRYYLADAVFVAAVGADRELLAGMEEALRRPAFPLYLGRRACPPAGPVSMGLRDGTVAEALRIEPWQASRWYRRKQSAGGVALDMFRDAADPHEGGEVLRDEPLSFDPARREYGWRTVVRDPQVQVSNPDGRRTSRIGHDPMLLLGEV